MLTRALELVAIAYFTVALCVLAVPIGIALAVAWIIEWTEEGLKKWKSS